MSAATLVLRNRAAIVGWVFMAAWMAMLSLFTYILVRDAGIPGWHPLAGMAVFALFWLFGVAGCAYVYGMPSITVTIATGTVHIRERFLFQSREERFPVRQLTDPLVVETKDSEGDRYFRCELATPTGRTIVCDESNDRARVEEACRRILTFIA